MKKIVLFSSMVLALCSCAKQYVETDKVVDTVSDAFKVVASTPTNTETKTHLDMTTYQMTWSPGDYLLVFNKDAALAGTVGDTFGEFTLSSDPGSSQGEFSGSMVIPAGDVVALYNTARYSPVSGARIRALVNQKQYYNAGGVRDGYVPMIAVGDRANLHFHHLGGILKFGLSDNSGRTVSSIIVSANEEMSGYIVSKLSTMLSNNYALNRYDASGAYKSITYNVGATLSSDPTYFHIVMFEGSYTNLNITVICSDDTIMTLQADSQTITRGHIHNKGSKAYVPNDPSPVTFTVDDGPAVNFNLINTTSVAENQKITLYSSRTENAVTSDEINSFTAWLGANNKKIDVDLSHIAYYSTQLDGKFRYVTLIRDFWLPKNLTATESSALSYASSNYRHLYLNEGLTTINSGLFYQRTVETVHLPSTLNTVKGEYNLAGCKTMVFDSGNTYFTIANSTMLIRNSDHYLISYANKNAATTLNLSDDIVVLRSYSIFNSPLTTLNISDNSHLTTILANAFIYSSKLKTINCALDTPPALAIGSGLPNDGTLTVPLDKTAAYYASAGWKDLVDNHSWTITDGANTISAGI